MRASIAGAERREQLKLAALRPWDLGVDPLNRPPLRPFEQVDKMVSGSQKIFNQLDKSLGGGFQQMQDLRLLDLANRKSASAPGGYQIHPRPSQRLPLHFFMNAVGVQRDVETMLHEASGTPFTRSRRVARIFIPTGMRPSSFAKSRQ